MIEGRWSAILSRVTPCDGDEFDDIAGDFDPLRDHCGVDLFPEVEASLMPSAKMKREDMVSIGFRPQPSEDGFAEQAARLASFALERDVEVIVLEDGPTSGMGRFGFRVERIAGSDPEAQQTCEDQIRRFWNIDLVL